MSEPEQAELGGSVERQPDRGRRPRVVVGVDGSPASHEALRRGLAEAAARGAELDAVLAAPAVVAVAAGVPISVADSASVRAAAERRLRAVVEEVGGSATGERDGDRGVTVRSRVVEGTPTQALDDAAAEADLLVVGSRGHGAVRSALLGSVALHCVTHARCPVLVVHEQSSAPTTSRPLVVAGADGSDTAPAVLAEAAREAERLGGDLDVVAVYTLEDLWGDPDAVVGTPSADVAARVRSRTEDLVADATGGPPVLVRGRRRTTIEVVEGAPREVLVQAAGGASVLVVGSSGSGVLRGVLIGSVALHCVVHAPCPVLVVPAHGGVPAPRPGPAGDRPAEAGSRTGRTA